MVLKLWRKLDGMAEFTWRGDDDATGLGDFHGAPRCEKQRTKTGRR
jgi:hypothetical protein